MVHEFADEYGIGPYRAGAHRDVSGRGRCAGRPPGHGARPTS